MSVDELDFVAGGDESAQGHERPGSDGGLDFNWNFSVSALPGRVTKFVERSLNIIVEERGGVPNSALVYAVAMIFDDDGEPSGGWSAKDSDRVEIFFGNTPRVSLEIGPNSMTRKFTRVLFVRNGRLLMDIQIASRNWRQLKELLSSWDGTESHLRELMGV